MASVITSVNCSGGMSLNVTLSYPNNMGIQVKIPVPDGDNTYRAPTTAGNYSFPGGGSHNFVSTVTTESTNGVSGDVTATAYLFSWPGTCQKIDPPAGHSSAQNFHVN